MNSASGWKTVAGGVCLIGTGALGFGATLLGYQGLPWDQALGLVGAGFGLVGLAGKFVKLAGVLEAIKKS